MKKRFLQLTLLLLMVSLASPAVVISEVFYDTPGNDNLEEWVELHNSGNAEVTLVNYTLNDNSGRYGFPFGVILPPYSYLVLARNASGFSALYGFQPDLEGMKLSLGNSGDELTLRDSEGNVLDYVAWANFAEGWSIKAETGKSIQRLGEVWLSDTEPTPGAGYGGGESTTSTTQTTIPEETTTTIPKETTTTLPEETTTTLPDDPASSTTVTTTTIMATSTTIKPTTTTLHVTTTSTTVKPTTSTTLKPATTTTATTIKTTTTTTHKTTTTTVKPAPATSKAYQSEQTTPTTLKEATAAAAQTTTQEATATTVKKTQSKAATSEEIDERNIEPPTQDNGMEEDPHTTIPYSPEKPAVASEPPQENLPTGYAISIIALGASALVSTVSLIVILLFLATGRIKFH